MRQVHHSEVVAIEGESYRLKEAKERAEQRTRKPRKGKSWLLPSGLQRGIPFLIQEDWTPDQALAVIELLDD